MPSTSRRGPLTQCLKEAGFGGFTHPIPSASGTYSASKAAPQIGTALVRTGAPPSAALVRAPAAAAVAKRGSPLLRGAGAIAGAALIGPQVAEVAGRVSSGARYIRGEVPSPARGF